MKKSHKIAYYAGVSIGILEIVSEIIIYFSTETIPLEGWRKPALILALIFLMIVSFFRLLDHQIDKLIKKADRRSSTY